MKDICIIDKIMRGRIIFWLTKIFLLAGSTWSAWESETDGCRRTTMLVMRTSSIRWKLDSKKESNIKSNFLHLSGGTHGRAGSRLLSCSRANHPRSHRCGQFVSGGNIITTCYSKVDWNWRRYEAWQSWNNEFGYFLNKMDWWVW